MAETQEELMSSEMQDQVIQRLASEVVEAFPDQRESLALIGIQRRGASLAERLKKYIDNQGSGPIEMGTLDITLYRDDLSTYGSQARVRESQIPFNVEDRVIILTDDVLYTGRTVRSALNAIVAYGRPRRILLLVLVDRGHRELPIQADFAGLTIDTTLNQIVHVHFEEHDGENNVLLHTRE